jgi:hypothetical protein
MNHSNQDDNIFNYILLDVKRKFLLNLLAFSVQYTITSYQPTIQIPLPMMLPLGTAFVLFYLFGLIPTLGIVLGGFCAYVVKGFTLPLCCWYLGSDLIAAFIGAYYAHRILVSDVQPFHNITTITKFVVVNAVVTSTLATIIRLQLKPSSIQHFSYLWLAAINGIFVTSTLFIPLGYQFYQHATKLSRKSLVALFAWFIFMSVSITFMQSINLIYLILLFALFSLVLAYFIDAIITNLIVFSVATIFVANFIACYQQYIDIVGMQNYWIIPSVVFMYNLIANWIALLNDPAHP